MKDASDALIDAHLARTAATFPGIVRDEDVYADDDLALDDRTVERQMSAPSGYVESDPWLARRGLTIGASEVAALFVAYDVEDPAALGTYAQKAGARRARGRWKNEPRIVLEKAGILPPLKAGKGAGRGLALERELVRQWRERVRRGTAGEEAAMIDGDSIAYVPDVLPIEIAPLPSRHCPALAVTPDAWARDLFGDLGAVEAKCSMHPYGCAKRQHVIQLHAQVDVLGATWAAVAEGEGWGAEWRDREGEPWGAIRTWPVEIDRGLIPTIHEVCTRAMARVLEIREASKRMEAA